MGFAPEGMLLHLSHSLTVFHQFDTCCPYPKESLGEK